MDHAITLGEVLWFALAAGGIIAFLAILGWIIKAIGQGMSR